MNQQIALGISNVMEQALATGLFISRCTASAPDDSLGPSGQASRNFVNIAGYTDIPCMIAVPSTEQISATEIKSLTEILARGLRHVTLGGYYPDFIMGVDAGWRVTVDGILYDLLGAEPDSQRTQTRLMVQLASV